MSLFDAAPTTTASSPPPPSASPSASLFDMVTTPSAHSPTQSPPPTRAPPAAAAPQAPQLQSYTAYEKNGLKITLTPKVSPTQPGVVQILARFTATTKLERVNFQVAVPKTQQLQMQAMSKPDVAPGATETQQLRILAPAGSQIRLRLRIAYSKDGQQITDQQDFSGFPANLTGGK